MPGDFDENQIDERSEADLDALADSDQSARNSERPMTKDDVPAPAAAAGKEDLFEFTHGGKTVKGTREQLIKWAQMGYDAPQRAQKLNQEKAKWEQDRQQWEQQWGVYREIDAYAKQNPDWLELVQNAWKTKGQGLQQQPGTEIHQDNPWAPKIQTLEQKLSQFESIIPTVQQIVQEKQEAYQASLDSKLDEEIRSIRDSHKDLDWDNLDENGKHLETRVLEHAKEIGTSSFKAAFRDLLHDDLVAKAASRGKIDVAKGIQARTKLGVLGESPTPTRGMPQLRNKNIRQTSYEDLQGDIVDEIRRGVYK